MVDRPVKYKLPPAPTEQELEEIKAEKAEAEQETMRPGYRRPLREPVSELQPRRAVGEIIESDPFEFALKLHKALPVLVHIRTVRAPSNIDDIPNWQRNTIDAVVEAIDIKRAELRYQIHRSDHSLDGYGQRFWAGLANLTRKSIAAEESFCTWLIGIF